jgi:hypothetical protein
MNLGVRKLAFRNLDEEKYSKEFENSQKKVYRALRIALKNCRTEKERLRAMKGKEIREFEEIGSKKVKAYLDEFLKEAKKDFSGNEFSEKTFMATAEYLMWLIWTLHETEVIACQLNIPPPKAKDLPSLYMVFQSVRILDDAIDGHEKYKELMDTSFGKILKFSGKTEVALKASVLTSFYVFLYGIERILNSSINTEVKIKVLEDVTSLYKKAVMGALLELSAPSEMYWKIVELKSISYSFLLVLPFLRSAGMSNKNIDEVKRALYNVYRLSQMANDLLDIKEDVEKDRPNFILLMIGRKDKRYLRGLSKSEILSHLKSAGFMGLAELEIAKATLRTCKEAEGLPLGMESPIKAKIADLYEFLWRYGAMKSAGPKSE